MSASEAKIEMNIRICLKLLADATAYGAEFSNELSALSLFGKNVLHAANRTLQKSLNSLSMP